MPQHFSGHVLDTLLGDIAERIQLSPTEYSNAVSRYNTLAEWLARDASQVAQYSPVIYPQGSFRTHSTIVTGSDDDLFDIDLLLELDIELNNKPSLVLQAVYDAINGEPGSRYFGKVEIKKRCVTLQHANMHLDVTPAVRRDNTPARVCQIFDLHPKRADHVDANPEGFADWFLGKILPAEVLRERVLAKAADIKPVPDQAPLAAKPPKLVALQLVKRWRDLLYRSERRVQRKPPSVLLSHLVAEVAIPNAGLFATLTQVVEYLMRRMNAPLLYVVNPAWEADVLTDRWPASLDDQHQFGAELKKFAASLAALATEGEIADKAPVLSEMFGERVSQDGFAIFAKRLASGGPALHVASSGAMSFGAGPGIVVPSHRFFGID